MSVELLLALFAFAVPGALAVQAWDWGIHKTNRPLANLLGYGIIVSLFSYALLELLTPLRLTNLVINGTLSLTELLRRENIFIFCGLCVGLYLFGLAWSKLYLNYISPGSWKSPYETVWGQVLTEAFKDEEARPWMVRFGRKWTGRAWRWCVEVTPQTGRRWLRSTHASLAERVNEIETKRLLN